MVGDVFPFTSGQTMFFVTVAPVALKRWDDCKVAVAPSIASPFSSTTFTSTLPASSPVRTNLSPTSE